jgi:hypothetical protein
MKPTTIEVWRKRVSEWEASGQPRGKFARAEGVHPATLGWWRWWFEAEAVAEDGLARSGDSRATSATFIEVVAPETFARAEVCEEAAAPSSANFDPMEIILQNGARIRVPSNFDAGALGRLIDTLEGR